MIRTVVVCEAQVPFVHGGAELHVRGLVDQLRQRGYRAERVSVPFKWYPKEELLTHAAAWRMVDLSESNGERIDLVVATKFPTYFVRHPHKVTWLFHQYRAIYDLCGTAYSEFGHTEADVRLRDKLMQLDRGALTESAAIFSNARNTAARLAHYNGVAAEPLYHPPPLAGKLKDGASGDYFLSVGRLETVKRVDLIIGALARVAPPLRLVIVGDGPLRRQLEGRAAAEGVADRVTFTGGIDEAALVDLYAGACAVVFPPYDEDYGYITLEAFLARKPVITTTDAGGPLEFVDDGVTGLVAPPDADAIGAAMSRLAQDRRLARSLGDAGYERARAITWDGVVERLVEAGGR
jgi:glycosyltransferase involved in cell wall biosynthesis